MQFVLPVLFHYFQALIKHCVQNVLNKYDVFAALETKLPREVSEKLNL